MVTPLLLQLALAAPWDAPTWAPLPWTPPPPPVGWVATEATWKLRIRDGEPVDVAAEYAFSTPAPSFANVRLVAPELLVTRASGPVIATPAGLVLALDSGPLTHEQQLGGLYAVRADGRMLLDIHPAAVMRVQVDAPGLDVTIDGAVDGALSPVSRLVVSWAPHRDDPAPVRAPLVNGEVATAFRAEGGELAIDSVVRWQVLRGELDSFRFEAPGLSELEVTGPGVASWSATGSTVTVKAKAKVKGLFSVRVKGRAPARGEGRVPWPEPSGVARVERVWTLGKADEGELIPIATPTSITQDQLPEWARGLGDGAPLAHWKGRGDLRVLPVAWDAVQGPDTVITSARFVVSAAREGRIALRQVYRVRNERRQYLHVRAAPGWMPIVVRVGGLPVSALDDGAGGLFIPLEKSVETLRGLLAFPVDVEWIGEDRAWARRGDHAFELPSVDAPVTTASWEVHLPRGYRALGRDGTSFAPTVDTSEDRRTREVVDSAVLKAASAYKENDFETAQRWLDEAKNYEAENEDVAQLQDNLDVLSGKAAPEVASSNVQARRVKELAKAKTSGLVDRQQVIEKDAEMNYRSGDYDKAEALWSEALRLANELERTEQAESTVQKSNIAEAEQRLSSIRDAKTRAKAPAKKGEAEVHARASRLGGDEWAGDAHREAPPAVEEESLEALGYLDAGGFGQGGGAGQASGYGYGIGTEPTTGEGWGSGELGAGTYGAALGGIALDGVDAAPVVVSVPGARAGGRKVSKEETKADRSRDDVAGADIDGADLDDANIDDREVDRKPLSRAMGNAVVLGPQKPRPAAPPPPPASATASSTATGSTTTSTSAPAPAPTAAPAAAPAAATVELRAPDDLPAMLSWADPGPLAQPGPSSVPPPPDGEPSRRARPPPERRKALDASPSPMALAMSLDSPAVTHQAALLPSGAFPTFTVRYKQLPGEDL